MTEVFKGATDQTFYFKMVDSTAGTPETGLTITNIDATYTRSLAAAVKNDLTALAAVTTAHTDNKGIEIDATNAPGLYRVDFPDAAFATGVDKVILNLTCTGCDPAFIHIDLVNINNQVAYVPNAAADAAGGLPISDAGGLDLDAQKADVAAILVDTGTTLDGRLPAALVGGRIDASVGAIAAAAITAASIAANAINDSKVDPDVTIASVTGAVGSVTAGVTVTTNNDKTGYALTAAYDPAKTASQAGDAMALTAGERTSTADAFLNRDMSTGADGGSTTVRTVRQALRFLRNKWSIAGGTLTVTKEDDATASWTAAITTTAGDPVSASDPAGP